MLTLQIDIIVTPLAKNEETFQGKDTANYLPSQFKHS